MAVKNNSSSSSNGKNRFHTETIFYSLKTNHDNIENEYITRAAFDGRRIPRRLLHEICRSELSNTHCNGLYNYFWLLCSAKTNIDPNDFAKENYRNAYLEVSLDSLMNALEARNKSICLKMLDQLKEKYLIDYEFHKKEKTFTVFILRRETAKDLSSKKYGFETSAIKKHLGFVFVSLSKVEETFASTEHYSVRDTLVYLWLHAIYGDTQFKASQKSAVVAFKSFPDYFTLKLSGKRLAMYWNCSSAQVYKVLHKLQNAGFLSMFQKNGRCLVITINHYSDWLWKRPSQAFTDDDVEVRILNRDSNPEIRAQQKEVSRLTSIAKHYNQLGKLFCYVELYENLIEAVKVLLWLQYRYHRTDQYEHDIWDLEGKMEYNVKKSLQNELFWAKLDAVFYQAYTRESPIFLAA